MDIEQFIRQAAKRGWSRQMTREQLGISGDKFRAILEVMEPLPWPAQGRSVGHYAARHALRGVCTKKQLDHLRAVAQVRRERAKRRYGEHEGSIRELAEKVGMVSVATVYRRLREGWDLHDALTKAATPINQRRKQGRRS